eukprot:TRINITY_DN107_c0_g1_i4.p1 TRINITY_DN107_c0_g1~~TRINITY_DN107_c0_g1_i4.p1  ORF type:complete len:344 (+),score=44.06 TRINITY_DN107_c0_g1_i4:55-1086(+)
MNCKRLNVALLLLCLTGLGAGKLTGTKGAVCQDFMCLGTGVVNQNGKCVRESTQESCNIPCGTTPKPGECGIAQPGAGYAGTSGKGGGQEINPAPSAPSSGTKSTRILNGMKGYTDMGDSAFLNFPPTMIGRWAQVPSVRSSPGYEMHMVCSPGHGGYSQLCDHFVIVYSCPPCQYENGGNIEALLLVKGFRPFRCGTSLDLDINVASHHHSLVVYHKTAAEGETDIVKAPKLLEFAFFAYSPATSDCSSYGNEGDCVGSIPGECAWNVNGGICERHLCPKPFRQHGPWQSQGKCNVCPHDASEDRFIPPVKTEAPNGFPPPPPTVDPGFPPPPPTAPPSGGR